MTDIIAAVNPMVVDLESGQTHGTTTITYHKDLLDELWERPMDGFAWELVNVHVRTGLGDEALHRGAYELPRRLKPGRSYEAGIFKEQRGPLTSDPLLIAGVQVPCLLKKPDQQGLITDQNHASGGTWHSHQIATRVPTNIIVVGASASRPVLDPNGMPRLSKPKGVPTTRLSLARQHVVELAPLLPGNHYFFLVLVADALGNWDFKIGEFETLRRRLTVKFETLHVYNDGDPAGSGQGEFWFRVFAPGRPPNETLIEEFPYGTQDIDDWSETDRPYKLGFTHIGALSNVHENDEAVWVSSHAIEHDGPLEANEHAGHFGVPLALPAGQANETVANQTFLLDCPPTSDDDFHYGVDVAWSAAYEV